MNSKGLWKAWHPMLPQLDLTVFKCSQNCSEVRCLWRKVSTWPSLLFRCVWAHYLQRCGFVSTKKGVFLFLGEALVDVIWYQNNLRPKKSPCLSALLFTTPFCLLTDTNLLPQNLNLDLPQTLFSPQSTVVTQNHLARWHRSKGLLQKITDVLIFWWRGRLIMLSIWFSEFLQSTHYVLRKSFFAKNK